jgi:hypothetical protein
MTTHLSMWYPATIVADTATKAHCQAVRLSPG